MGQCRIGTFSGKNESNFDFFFYVNLPYPLNAKQAVPGGGVRPPQREADRTGWGVQTPQLQSPKGDLPPGAACRFSEPAARGAGAQLHAGWQWQWGIPA